MRRRRGKRSKEDDPFEGNAFKISICEKGEMFLSSKG